MSRGTSAGIRRNVITSFGPQRSRSRYSSPRLAQTEPENEQDLENMDKVISDSWYRTARNMELERDALVAASEEAVAEHQSRANAAEVQRNELWTIHQRLIDEVRSFRAEKDENDHIMRLLTFPVSSTLMTGASCDCPWDPAPRSPRSPDRCSPCRRSCLPPYPSFLCHSVAQPFALSH